MQTSTDVVPVPAYPSNAALVIPIGHGSLRTSRRLKLKDHINKSPVTGRERRRKIVLAHKRAQCKRFVRDHIRRVHELYCLENLGGNVLDSIDLLKMKDDDKPKELLLLLEKYCLTRQVEPVVVAGPTGIIELQPPRLDLPKVKLGKPPEKSPEKQLSVRTISTPPSSITPSTTPTSTPCTTPSGYFPSSGTSTPMNSIFNQSLDKMMPEKSGSSRGPKRFSEKLKAEAAVVQRVTELQKDGMWYDKRLPKAHDQPRLKSHWDYLLEEMQWLAVDFAVEKKWKRIAARKCARMVEKYYADKKLAEEKAKKDEKVRVQKIAAFMAKEIRNFWSNVRKLVEYKEQSKIEELRKKTMDQHLSFIVDQTEKISSMLAESFSTDVKPHRLALENDTGSVADTQNTLKIFDEGLINSLSDDEFLPSPESEDDEETIAVADTEAKDVRREVDLLKQESEMAIDDILDTLPPQYVQVLISGKVEPKEDPEEDMEADVKCETDEYEPSGSESDFEDTIVEEERMAGTGGAGDTAAAEIKELEEDNLLSVEQLRAKYMMKPSDSDNESTDVDNTMETEEDTEVNDSEEDEESSVFGDGDDANSAEDQEQQSSLATLLQTFAPERAGEDHGDDELNSVAALAESFQPKGYTLSSTSVVTKIPPLLKHVLREYQHIGLDWLVTMYDKKLNGILADEMGLGKTIQTIALLAHLACEKGNWGPHLIIVPTSVMLNWQMEFLKWCPGFKVLTYYGSIKERKAKRTGWTKPNTFHICITSYKILIQDHQAFRRKRWKYLILDEAQNIKNFKSQRWQLLLNFSTQRRLLLTGTPLQNNLMELWSLMHFLMPNVFQSHREFRQWFSNPMTGMIEGNSEYNENIIKRLHKVLRPFILRRLKSEVEKQLPQKYEHVVLCRLSKRQRYLYEDFMSRAKTKETLQTGSLLSVINVLMQLRKVCNHPNLFEPRPIISPLQTRGFPYEIPSLVWNMRDDEQENTVSYNVWSVTGNEQTLDRQLAKKLRSFVSKNYRLTIRYLRGNPIMETINFLTPKLDSLRNVIDLSHNRTEGDIVIPIDGDEDCSIIFEQKSDPSTVRKKMYTFQKSIVPNPPRLKTPFALFTVDTNPTESLIDDQEFLAGLKQDLERQEALSLRSQSSSTLISRDGWIEMSSTNASRPPSSKRKPRVTKLSNSQYPMKLATTANGSDVIVTTNGVRVVKSEQPQIIKTTTVPYASLRSKRKRPIEVDDEDRRSLLDAVVVDFEDTPDIDTVNPILEPTAAPTESEQLILSPPKRNGIDDSEEIDVFEDSGGEADGIPSKIARLDSPVRRRQRQNSDSPSPRKGARYTEDEEDGTSTRQKRKRSTNARSPKRRRIDLFNIELEEVVYRRLLDRQAVISNIKTINNRRLLVHTVFGADLLYQVRVIGVLGQLRFYQKQSKRTTMQVVNARPEVREHESHGYFNLGYHEVMLTKRTKMTTNVLERNHPFNVWRITRGLLDLIWTLSDVMEMLENILKRFIIHTPAVSAPRIQTRVFHPSVSRYSELQTIEQKLSTQLKEPLEPLRPMFSAMETQFPDPRLIQYDCGKLQVLDGLLRRLKAESHRVLIFTQMAKMLDVLEAFLNHHGYIYLRLDGATKIDQRQLLMERFNTDKRIFCFILSTRSGGIGVNLTGADTVIFYDSDWNPTMDAQAQDRCHRIGQTRDVHIYRLVSEKTVEENILKKSNQKKLLGELAIEGGNFTTAYFKKNTIHDIFDVDEGEVDAQKRMAEILETPVSSPQPIAESSTQLAIGKEEDETNKKSAKYILESALAAAEDDSDVQAARTVTAEAAAELAEFDEDIPLVDEEANEVEEPSPIEQEMEYIMSELSSVELYALRFMENTIDDWSKETFANAQRELEIQKLEWEQEQQQQNESEMIFGDPVPLLSAGEQLEDMLTYPMLPQEFWFDEVLGYGMPVYGPPTPPLGDDDVYIDHSTAMLYDVSTTIPDHLLPKVWQGPKTPKGTVVDSPPVKNSVDETIQENSTKKSSSSVMSGLLSKTIRRDEPIFAPRSLFDRPSPALAKMRRDYKIQKMSKTNSKFPGALSVINTQPLPKTLGPPGAISFPVTVPKASQQAPTDILEWTIPEDNALLQSITTFLELPPNLLIVNLAQTPNWDFSTEVVNTLSRINRSQKQCKMRYEQVIQPREEGKYVEPVTIPPKKKKAKSFIKLSPPPVPKGRRLKTSEIVANDNNSQYKTMFSKKFSTMMSIPKDRKDLSLPSSTPANPPTHSSRAPKQHIVFADHGINFDTPIPLPVIANQRLERLLAERQKQIATQRAQQAELVAAAAAARNSSSIIRLPQQQMQRVQLVSSAGTPQQEQQLLQQQQQQQAIPQQQQQQQLQRVQLVGSPTPEQLAQAHGVLLGINKSSAPPTSSVVSTVQGTPTLIGTLSQPPGVLLPPQGQTLPQRAALIPMSRSPIQIHQPTSIQAQQTNTLLQKPNQTVQSLILTPQQQQHSTIVTSTTAAQAQQTITAHQKLNQTPTGQQALIFAPQQQHATIVSSASVGQTQQKPNQTIGQTLTLAPSQQQQQLATIVTSSAAAAGQNTGLPIVIPVSSPNIVRGMSPNQTIGQSTSPMAHSHKFIITQREGQTPVQVHSQSQSPIILTITIPVNTISGPQGAYSQGQIVLPARSSTTTTVTSGTQVGLTQAIQQPVLVPGKGVPSSPQQVSLVRGPVTPGIISTSPGVMSTPVKFSPGVRQTLAPTRLVEYPNSQQPYFVSAMTLGRAANPLPPLSRYGRLNRTPSPSGLTYRRSPTNESTIQVSPRPLTNPSVRTQLFTPVSQISLVRGTVPSSSSTTVTSIPVTTKTSLLRQAVPVTTESQRPQLFQRPQIISGPIPANSQFNFHLGNSPAGPTILLTNVPRGNTNDPPKLIVNSSTAPTTGVYTIYTTTTTTTTAATAGPPNPSHSAGPSPGQQPQE